MRLSIYMITVVIEYESNGFPGTEYTIDLSQFQFPDASGLSFDDLMPGGLIVIQTDDQDANKENVDHVRSVDAMGTVSGLKYSVN